MTYVLKSFKYYWRSMLSLILLFAIIGITIVMTLQTHEVMKLHTEQELEQQWRTDYDLLVRPNHNSSTLLDNHHLIRRSDMEDIRGGISFEQGIRYRDIPEGNSVLTPNEIINIRDKSDLDYSKLNENLEKYEEIYSHFDMSISAPIIEIPFRRGYFWSVIAVDPEAEK